MVIRQEVLSWVSEQRRTVSAWLEEADVLTKETEKRNLQKAFRGTRQELERSMAASQSLIDQVLHKVSVVSSKPV